VPPDYLSNFFYRLTLSACVLSKTACYSTGSMGMFCNASLSVLADRAAIFEAVDDFEPRSVATAATKDTKRTQEVVEATTLHAVKSGNNL
jgi:hypothetical protein